MERCAQGSYRAGQGKGGVQGIAAAAQNKCLHRNKGKFVAERVKWQTVAKAALSEEISACFHQTVADGALF